MVNQINSVSPFSPTEFLASESPLVEELTNQALDQGVNLAYLVATTYLKVEQNAQGKTNLKIDELEVHQKKLENITNFLTRIEDQLGNRDTKEVALATQADLDLLAEMRLLLPDSKILKKNTWTREEAGALQQALTRHSQIILQKVSQSSSEVNRAIEEGMELLQIARKCLEMLDRLHNTFTSNQRSR